MYECFDCVYVHHVCALCSDVQKKESDPLELQLWIL